MGEKSLHPKILGLTKLKTRPLNTPLLKEYLIQSFKFKPTYERLVFISYRLLFPEEASSFRKRAGLRSEKKQ